MFERTIYFIRYFRNLFILSFLFLFGCSSDRQGDEIGALKNTSYPEIYEVRKMKYLFLPGSVVRKINPFSPSYCYSLAEILQRFFQPFGDSCHRYHCLMVGCRSWFEINRSSIRNYHRLQEGIGASGCDGISCDFRCRIIT